MDIKERTQDLNKEMKQIYRKGKRMMHGWKKSEREEFEKEKDRKMM